MNKVHGGARLCRSYPLGFATSEAVPVDRRESYALLVEHTQPHNSQLHNKLFFGMKTENVLNKNIYIIYIYYLKVGFDLNVKL